MHCRDFMAAQGALRGMSAEQIDEVAREVGRLQSSPSVVEAAEYDQFQKLPLVVSVPSVDKIWYCEKKEDANHDNLIWKSGGIVKVMGEEKLDSITKESNQLKTDDGLGIKCRKANPAPRIFARERSVAEESCCNGKHSTANV